MLTRPVGVPADWEEHAKLMFDLQVLALQADITRVITFQLAREVSTRTYPQIGVAEPHHATSHHQNSPEKLAKLAKINAYHVSLFAYLLEKLQATKDGDGTLLDHSLYVLGSGLGNPDVHDHTNLPILVAGGGSQMKGGRHIKYAQPTPLANLHATLLDKVGVPTDGSPTATARSTSCSSRCRCRRMNDVAEICSAAVSSPAVAVDRQRHYRCAARDWNVAASAAEPDGTTPLHRAVHRNDLKAAEALIRAGADVNAVNRYGVPPLSLAATNGNAAMLELLLKAGANPNAAQSEGETALMTAARTGVAAAVKTLLAHGADVNAKESWRGQTALMWAAAEGHAETIQLLLEAGAQINARSNAGWTKNSLLNFRYRRLYLPEQLIEQLD